MEPSLYPDESDGPNNDVKKLKMSMTLDFNSSSSMKRKNLAAVLASPDLNMLKLASPELEKMIIQANGMVTTTPTPTQFIFPKFVTEEQEAYARGFVDALAKLQGVPHTRALNPPNRPLESDRTFTTLTVPSALSQSAALPSSSVVVPSTNEVAATTILPGGPINCVPVRTTVSPPKAVFELPTSVSNLLASGDRPEPRLLPHIKDEPQTVPCLGSSPPLSPINMESQEKIKLERKRARNRVAARKCRTRKLEKISRLEDRVKELKGQNGDLVNTAVNLRDQVMKLKQQIVEHVNSGCQIMMAQNISF